MSGTGVTVTETGIFVGKPIEAFFRNIDAQMLPAIDAEALRFVGHVQDNLMSSPHGFKQTVDRGNLINSVVPRESTGSFAGGGYRGGVWANPSKFSGSVYHAAIIEYGRKPGKGLPFTTVIVNTGAKGAPYKRNGVEVIPGRRKVHVSVIDDWIQRRMALTGKDLKSMLQRWGVALSMSRRMKAFGLKPRAPFGRALREHGPKAKQRLGATLQRAMGVTP